MPSMVFSVPFRGAGDGLLEGKGCFARAGGCFAVVALLASTALLNIGRG
jgi:hypothetical protein